MNSIGKNDKPITFKNEYLEQYKNEFNKDVSLNLNNIHEKSMLVSSIRAKWLNYYFKETENLETLKTKKKQLLEKKLSETSGNVSMLKMKNEENILKNNELNKKLTEAETIVKSCISYIEYAINILNDFGFQIKNCIEILKLERS